VCLKKNCVKRVNREKSSRVVGIRADGLSSNGESRKLDDNVAVKVFVFFWVHFIPCSRRNNQEEFRSAKFELSIPDFVPEKTLRREVLGEAMGHSSKESIIWACVVPVCGRIN